MELIITEKPSSAQKIAHALADRPPKKRMSKNKVTYWECVVAGAPVMVVGAAGHLYSVAEKKKNGWTYPVFDTHWVPSHETDKGAAFTKKYLSTIESLAKKADTITIATDYDIEGEVIGYTILRYACGRTDGQRMKFSTVTSKDLRASYNEKSDRITQGLAQAGVCRHEIDWYYGINLSRALTNAVKSAGGFKLLSSGRVQTPALKILADKERDIKAFVPVPYWDVELAAGDMTAAHTKNPFAKQEEANAAQAAVGTEASVTQVDRKQFQQAPPEPFDLTTLQTEAYRSFGMSPKETLSRAQDLYSAGYISYPRTSSQQLPEEIGYRAILEALAQQGYYRELVDALLQKPLRPNNGKKTDPAHPAIFPTGETPEGMDDRAARVYDLVVRRFLATFGEPATRETMTVTLESNGQSFVAKGTRTVELGWHTQYGHHVKLKDEQLPDVQHGQTLPVQECVVYDKETQPPRRYTPSSIIRELEKRGLGTKATRADIIENLFSRGYVHEKSIHVTELGLRTVDTLERHVPEILDETFTHQLEEELERIQEGTVQPEAVLSQAREQLTKLLTRFKQEQEAIGKELLDAHRETQDAQSTLGKCPNCTDGQLQIRRGKFGMFVGCTGYPECKTTFALPKGGYAKPAGSVCDACGYPHVVLKYARSAPRTICINPHCPSKHLTPESYGRKTQVEQEEVPCPDCGKRLVVRKSAYGEFIGCSGYPKCRHTEQLAIKEQ